MKVSYPSTDHECWWAYNEIPNNPFTNLVGLKKQQTIREFMDVFIRNWQKVHKRRNRFEIPWLTAILGTKFPKEDKLVHKTAISCATQNSSASKIFEKMILKQIHYLESTNKLDLTGKQQHCFKKSKSTATLGTLLQSLISRATNENCYVIMASLDWSMAFDLVNIEAIIIIVSNVLCNLICLLCVVKQPCYITS